MKSCIKFILIATLIVSCDDSKDKIENSLKLKNAIEELNNSIDSSKWEFEKRLQGDVYRSFREDDEISKYLNDTVEMVPSHMRIEVKNSN